MYQLTMFENCELYRSAMFENREYIAAMANQLILCISVQLNRICGSPRPCGGKRYFLDNRCGLPIKSCDLPVMSARPNNANGRKAYMREYMRRRRAAKHTPPISGLSPGRAGPSLGFWSQAGLRVSPALSPKSHARLAMPKTPGRGAFDPVDHKLRPDAALRLARLARGSRD